MVITAVVVLVWQRLVADCFNYCGHSDPCFRLTSLKRHSAVKTLNTNNNNNKLNQPQPTSASNIISVLLNNLIVYKMYFLFKQQLWSRYCKHLNQIHVCSSFNSFEAGKWRQEWVMRGAWVWWRCRRVIQSCRNHDHKTTGSLSSSLPWILTRVLKD